MLGLFHHMIIQNVSLIRSCGKVEMVEVAGSSHVTTADTTNKLYLEVEAQMLETRDLARSSKIYPPLMKELLLMT